MRRTPLSGPSAWVGPEIQNESDWIEYLDESAVAEIDAALASVESRGLQIPFSVEDFPLPGLVVLLDRIPEHLENGRGFVLVRGLPRDRYTREQCELIYWGIGVNLGTPISQNTRGHLLGHVRDEGKDFDDPTVRGYQTHAKMDFHADQLPVDVLGLFCVRTAKSGGQSALVAVDTVHNVLLEERPDLLDVLYQPFNLDWRGEEPPGQAGWYTSPMFSYCDGKVTSRVTSRQYFNTVTRFGDELALTEVQREALDAVQEISNRPELRLSMMFQEGDMQFLNNHALLHARTEFEDYEEEDRKRHLLRMWVAFPPERRRLLAPELAERYEVVEMGGIPARAAS
ncbi:MAG: TauD/TfdA family dioxygenase [Acidimicrobiia bacterium]|nr:TauD/TfdA family dioxygenase [Acidimicrobiia bacterium]MDH4306440.1 TauD/TfdA family dioxygenase [Acidimicrobiia bacterium]MDH5294610.1 TauD/TfdA family dioxygenase [Acidimicrobiia bacterium]